MPVKPEHLFQRTLKDLQDCQDHLFEPLPPEEDLARDHLVQVCREIVAAARQIASARNSPSVGR